MASELLGSFVIALREALEASLITAIILTVLYKTGRHGLVKYVYIGVASSILLGIATGAIVWTAYKGFPEKELFEAASSFIAVALLTSVIYWMAKTGPRLTWEISHRVSLIATGLGLLVFTFIIVYREVLETVLLIAPYTFKNPPATMGGLIIGVVTALGIAYMMYVAGYKVNLRKFFMATSILLVFIASGILGYGMHELAEWIEEEGVYDGFLTEKAYNLGLDSSNPLHHKGVVGSILAVLFGYSTSMEWMRLIAQGTYLIAGLILMIKAYGIKITSRK
ncbi:MAG: FTR1 family protein [Desulfurococcales archaeon]|nr:FTR1 family protein [Desulfurococcales archaeon]